MILNTKVTHTTMMVLTTEVVCGGIEIGTATLSGVTLAYPLGIAHLTIRVAFCKSKPRSFTMCCTFAHVNMAVDSHQLLPFAIENDNTCPMHLILINERILHQQAKRCAVSRHRGYISTPKHTLHVKCMPNTSYGTNLPIIEYRITSCKLILGTNFNGI